MIFADGLSDMPDFSALDKTILVTVLSAAATFVIVLAAGLMLLKSKNRTLIKRRRKRGGKAWRASHRRRRIGLLRLIRSALRYDPKKFLLLIILFSVAGVMYYTTPDDIRNNSRHKSGNSTYDYKRNEGGGYQSRQTARKTESRLFFCHSPYIIDGDTFDCAGTRIRLMGIDAPEMPDHCREGRRCTEGDPFAAKKYLQSLTAGRVNCRAVETDHYGRTIARCTAGERDLSCAMIASGHAVRRYNRISCP